MKMPEKEGMNRSWNRSNPTVCAGETKDIPLRVVQAMMTFEEVSDIFASLERRCL
jgi:hypothetical protein